MKAAVAAADLARVTADAARVIDSRPSVPALAAAVLTARGGEDGGSLVIEGANEVAAVRSGCDATTGEPGRIGVPGRHLAAIAATLSGEVTLTATDSGLTLSAGHKRFVVPVMDLHFRPDPPQLPTATEQVDGNALQRAVAAAATASRDTAVTWFSDARLEAADGLLAVYGASGERVSRHVLSLLGDGDPVTAVAHANQRALTDALRGTDDVVHLGFGEHWLSVAVGQRTTGVRLADHAATGNNLSKINSVLEGFLRRPVLATLSLDRDDLLAMAAEAQAVEADRVALLPFPDRIEYTAVGSGGDITAEVPAIGDTEAEGLVVGLKPGYLTDAVRSVAGDVLSLSFRQPPALLTFEGSDSGTHFLGTIKIGA